MDEGSGPERPDARLSEYARTREPSAPGRDGLGAPRPGPRAGSPLSGRGEPIDDLEQVALLGLVKAVERFDPSLGIAFPNFAVPTIQGELKRHFRGQWMVRVPRSLQERVLDLGRSIDELTNRERPLADAAPSWPGRWASPRRCCSRRWRLGSRTRRWRWTRPSRTAAVTGPAACSVGRTASSGRVERGLLVETLLCRLAPREQAIIRLRFFDEMTQSEIAAQVGLSQMQVSRLIRHSLEHLRALAAEL